MDLKFVIPDKDAAVFMTAVDETLTALGKTYDYEEISPADEKGEAMVIFANVRKKPTPRKGVGFLLRDFPG